MSTPRSISQPTPSAVPSFRHFIREPAPAYGPMSWQPHWEVVMIYDRPDVTSAGEFGRHYFVNRHVNPDVPVFDWSARVGRDSPGIDEVATGCHTSGASMPTMTSGQEPTPTIGPASWGLDQWTPAQLNGGQLHSASDARTAHQRDWDYLTDVARRALDEAGAAVYASDIAKIRALATYCLRSRGKVHPSRHPVDVDLHSSFCVGSANLMAALCHVSGLNARTIHTENHSMCEVWDGRRWTFVDNYMNDAFGDEPLATPRPLFASKNFVQAIIEPRESGDDPMPEGQRNRYLISQPATEPFVNVGSLWWRFNGSGAGLNHPSDPLSCGSAMCVLPGPDNVRAIYPEWAEPEFVSRTGNERELVLNPCQGWCRTVCWIDRGRGICQRFYVGGLRDSSNPVRACRADLHLAHGPPCEFSPARGGWTFDVNGTAVPLGTGDFELRGDILSLHVPLHLLHEHAHNEIRLWSTSPAPQLMAGGRDKLVFWVWPDVLGTGKPWYWRPTSDNDYTLMGPVLNTHSAWFLLHNLL